MYSFVDEKGCIHRSRFSPPGSITIANGNSIDVKLPTCKLHRMAIEGMLFIEVYRTLNLGSYYYRVGRVANSSNAESVTFSDTVSDASLESHEPLYAQPDGAELENLAANPWLIGCMHQSRHVYVDMENPSTHVYYTSQKVKGEGYQYNDVLLLQVPRDGGDVTALASFQDKLLIFKGDRVYATYGEGYVPGTSGSGYAEPELLSNATGCMNQLSVVLCHTGLLFEGDTAIWLLTEKLDLQQVGEKVNYMFGRCAIVQALNVPGKDYVVFLTDDADGDGSGCIVYHYMDGIWGYFGWPGVSGACIAYSQVYFKVPSTSTVRTESRSVYTNAGSAYYMAIETGWISPGSIGGWARFYKAVATGHLNSACKIRCKFAYDGVPYWEDSQLFDASSWTTFGENDQFGLGLASTYQDDQLQVDFASGRQRCSSFRIHISDENPSAGSSLQAFTLTALSVLIGVQKGAIRLGDSRRV
jgi:hypothetical protein